MKREVSTFIKAIENETQRSDSMQLVRLMEQESGYKAVLHGTMVGFGLYHYVYESGREGDAMVTGFSPRSQHIAIYIMPGFSAYQDELQRLGKHKTGKSCLYIKKLADIDEAILRRMVSDSVQVMQRKYPCREAS